MIRLLLEEPQRYGYFQTLRLLERWMQRQEGLSTAQVFERRIAIRNSLSLSFPVAEIERLDTVLRQLDEGATDPDAVPQSRDVQRIDITPAVIGLLGSGGVLPTHYTELLAERETFHRDRAARAFLDIFVHRAGVLFYQAWGKHRLAVQYEADRRNRYLPLVLAVAGLGQQGVRDRLRAREGGVADDALAHYAGALQSRPISAVAVQRVLQQYFRIPVRLEPFIGRWFTLPQDKQSHLGMANMQLGRDAVMGERVWQRDLRLRLTLGPMPLARFRRFLPGGAGAIALRELLALMTGATLEYEVRLSLRAEDVQGTRLDPEPLSQLGFSSFLCTAPETRDRCDVAYDLLAWN